MRTPAAVLLCILSQAGAEAPLRLDASKKTAPLKFVVDHLDLSTPGGTTEKKEFRTTLEATLSLEPGPRVSMTIRRLFKQAEQRKTDSAAADDSPPARLFKTLCGSPLGLRPGVSKADDIEGLQDLVAKAAKASGAPERAVGELKKWLGDLILQDVAPLVFFHPSKPQAVGGTWSTSFGTSEDYPLDGKATWTLQARKDGRALLKMKTVLKSLPPPKREGERIVFVRDLAGTMEGTIDLEDSSGWFVMGTFSRDLTGKSFLQGLASTYPGDIWSVTSKSMYMIAPEK